MRRAAVLAAVLGALTLTGAAAAQQSAVVTGQPRVDGSNVQAASAAIQAGGPSSLTAGSETPAVLGAPTTYLARPSLTCSDFKRGPDGTWTANQAVSLPTPNGPLKIDPGSSFHPGQTAGGEDLGAMLERQCPG